MNFSDGPHFMEVHINCAISLSGGVIIALPYKETLRDDLITTPSLIKETV